ncbi:hypothetical protein [Bosea rubneri]|uniref:Uncharacterized protein n=1 Tax=Bosea rubneri TaxID=3075434 RepID=A0ABU3S4B8_9HYPH|nr:hypothetical protein [Bosea sp. ZW T0_25]MDU0339576.1 hypothetical protein [Bosea sp. ZW T0_25]
MRDLASNIAVITALSPAVQAATVNGVAIDTKGFGSCAFVLTTGAIAGSGEFGAKLQESDASGSGYTDVDPAELVGAFEEDAFADATEKVSYVGHKRFVRLVLTKAAGTSIAAGAVAILGHAAERPIP